MRSRGLLKFLGGSGAVASMIGTGVGIGRLTLEPDDSMLKSLQDENRSLDVKLTENGHRTNKLDLSNSDLVNQLEEARKIHKLQNTQKDKKISQLEDKVNQLTGNQPKTRELKSSIDKFEDRNLPGYITVFDKGVEKGCIMDYSETFKDDFDFTNAAHDDDGICKTDISKMTPYNPIVR